MGCPEYLLLKYFCSLMLENDYFFLCMTIFNMSFNDTVQQKIFRHNCALLDQLPLLLSQAQKTKARLMP